MKLDQNKAPLYQALCEYRENRIVSFDVPGHKQGKGNPGGQDKDGLLGVQVFHGDVLLSFSVEF